jgi:hypothetical protein
MSKPDPDTARLIDDEAEHAETTRQDPYPPGTIAERRNRARSSVYSVRLNDDEIAEIHRLAHSANVPASTLVRSWITQHITNTRPTTTIDPALRDAIRTEVEAAVKAALTDTPPHGKQSA